MTSYKFTIVNTEWDGTRFERSETCNFPHDGMAKDYAKKLQEQITEGYVAIHKFIDIIWTEN